MAKKIDDAVLDELLKGCERPECVFRVMVGGDFRG